MQSKKTLVITDPLTHEVYDETVDIKFEDNRSRPIICVPIMDKDEQRIEGCIEAELKMKSYLSSNPILGGEGEFKLDTYVREILEIFSNQIRVAIERLNDLRRNQFRKSKVCSPLLITKC